MRVELCTIAALGSLATRCFWSRHRVGEIKMASPVSLRLREGFVRYSRLDLSGGERWDVDGMRPRLEGERRW